MVVRVETVRVLTKRWCESDVHADQGDANARVSVAMFEQGCSDVYLVLVSVWNMRLPTMLTWKKFP